MTHVHPEISNTRDWLWVEFPLPLKLLSRVKFQFVDTTASTPWWAVGGRLQMGVSGCDTRNGSAATVVDTILPQLLSPVQLLLFMLLCQDLTQASWYSGRDGMCQQRGKRRLAGTWRGRSRWQEGTADRASGCQPTLTRLHRHLQLQKSCK